MNRKRLTALFTRSAGKFSNGGGAKLDRRFAESGAPRCRSVARRVATERSSDPASAAMRSAKIRSAEIRSAARRSAKARSADRRDASGSAETSLSGSALAADAEPGRRPIEKPSAKESAFARAVQTGAAFAAVAVLVFTAATAGPALLAAPAETAEPKSAWFAWRKLAGPPRVGPPVLYVTAYSSFLSLNGPGRFLKEKFESRCGCNVQYAKAANSVALLQRAALPVKQDLIIGLDQLSLAEADPSLFEKTPFSQEERFIPEMQNLPYPCRPLNYAPIGWIVRGRRGPESFPDLLREEKISFPDPRTSSLGLLLLYWMDSAFRGERDALKAFLQKLKPKVYGGSLPSWSLSYGFFQRGRVSASLSYLSSLAYHIIEEGQGRPVAGKDPAARGAKTGRGGPDPARARAARAKQGSSDYRFAVFKGGAPRQTEFVCLLKKSPRKDLAEQFVNFLLSGEAQDIIMRRNYMFPTVKHVRKGVFAELPLPPPLKTQNGLKRFIQKKKALLKLWKEAMD